MEAAMLPGVGPAGGMPMANNGAPGGEWAPEPAAGTGRFVPRGQGILSSAGRHAIDGNTRLRRMELIWLVPRPPK
jgi:hypothetical protein